MRNDFVTLRAYASLDNWAKRSSGNFREIVRIAQGNTGVFDAQYPGISRWDARVV
jgi:hypothetical protein